MDPESFKKMLIRLEKAIYINQDMRLKYAKDPTRFLDSEVELDDCIRSLTSLSAYPQLFQLFARSKILPDVIMLLQHENHDIAGGIINFLQELVSATVEPEQADDLLLLYSALVNGMIFEAVVECIERFNESKTEEAELIHKCLSIIESMIEIRSNYCRDICNRTKILKWLVNRVQHGYMDTKTIDDIKLYASEVLVQLIQNTKENRQLLAKMGGIDQLLLAVAPFRKENPESAEDIEIMNNLFDALDLSILDPEHLELFHSGEGTELMIKILKYKGRAAIRAYKTIAIATKGSLSCCKAFANNGGLGLVFPIIMRKGLKDVNPKNQQLIDESSSGILKNLFRHFQDSYLLRLLTRFTEEINIQVILHMRKYYVSLKAEEQPTKFDEEAYLKQLEEGQAVVENSDVVLLEAFYQGDEKVRNVIHECFAEDKLTLVELLISLGNMIDFMQPNSDDQKYYEGLAEGVASLLSKK